MVIYIWGIGRKSQDMIDAGAIQFDHIVGFVETQKSTSAFMGKPVYSFEEFLEVGNFDYLFIAVKRNDAIFNLCKSYQVDLNKICFMYPNKIEQNTEKNLNIAKNILTQNGYLCVCENYGISVKDWIAEDAIIYEKLNKYSNFRIDEKNNYYISEDKYMKAGNLNSYFWQDLWAAKKIYQNAPKEHFDIGSRIDGFIAHILSFGTKVNLIDIRPLKVTIDNLTFTCADATNLDTIEDDSIESLSALCSLEHFGLGRYGDPIDPDACFKCFAAINRKMKSGGNVYIAVPIGKEHIEFNAHRVFYASTVVDCFEGCTLKEFSSAKNDEYEENIDIHKYDKDASLGGTRFGLFHMVKR